jgi:hypothetical protein
VGQEEYQPLHLLLPFAALRAATHFCLHSSTFFYLAPCGSPMVRIATNSTYDRRSSFSFSSLLLPGLPGLPGLLFDKAFSFSLSHFLGHLQELRAVIDNVKHTKLQPLVRVTYEQTSLDLSLVDSVDSLDLLSLDLPTSHLSFHHLDLASDPENG